MLREIAFHSFYVPTVTLLFVFGYLVTLAVDRILIITGAYRYIWHPSLFRIAIYIVICCGMSLVVYH